MGVLKSFISQLKPGQDLTRVSLPSVLLFPYSLLEAFGHRELSAFPCLASISDEETPLGRMLCILRWFFATIQQEVFHKKPYNPVIGETHSCSTTSLEFGHTQFFSEQVSHHPPVSALYVRNDKMQISNSCAVSFGVKFGGNSISIVTEGSAVVISDKWNETYEVAKRTPDMTVKNLIIGTKRIYWNGECTIKCPQTSLSATLNFKESGQDSMIAGSIFENDKKLFSIKGVCGGPVYYSPPKGNEKTLLIDIGALPKVPIQYPSAEELEQSDSLYKWKDVNKYILENDMEKADEAKKLIETAQRKLLEEGTHQPKYFVPKEGGGWKYSPPSQKFENDTSE